MPSSDLRKTALAVACALMPTSILNGAPLATSMVSETAKPTTLTAFDLARLSDIGPTYPAPGLHLLSLSPDGRKIAVQTRRADPSANKYDSSIIVIDIGSRATPTTIDSGGEFILQFVDGVGGARVSTGYAAGIPLRWSRDGNWVYFLKRMNGTTQIWRAAADGAGSERLSSEPDDVEEFSLKSNGRELIYSVLGKVNSGGQPQDAEARQGYRYDVRFVPLFANGPQAFSATRRVVRSLDLSTRIVADATPSDTSELENFIQKLGAEPTAVSRDGRTASSSQAGEIGGSSGGKISAEDASRRKQVCVSAICAGASAVWWTSDDTSVRFIRRGGWGDSETEIYEWKLGAAEPRRLYTTTDLLLDCQPLGRKLLCAREQSTVPRHIILLDPDTSQVELVYDPNPEFNRFALGRVERLNWRNRFGIETFGDLVYPTGYVKGRTYPLIVVQYTSRGFLRGGVGDEFPIQPFANRGYAILSVQRPDSNRLGSSAKTAGENERTLLEDFRDRRSVLSAVEIAVRSLAERGIVDMRYIGITGLSDGSSTVQFAMINSNIFKAASVSGCCWEPFQDALVGPSGADAFHQLGWPQLIDYRSDFWSHISLVANARGVSTPLLIQQSDDEFRGAVASYMALKQAHQPAALYVFPDEHHVKWQPAHRLAAYERNIRWFDYWLRGIGDAREWQDGAPD
ncbi:Atxe2 family lasso peptide isopeptidase [Sphingobium sp. DC-2]|uniref:Atxe2 family lasso peptide isopeptidase n=1 Tax=Sphingobium sp. DC-2 TaxID=1303256 RepID=UPI00068FF673|nr:Atxe2 family lasso peptide isopeptidase [Sphingobium sp. DC-2]